MVSKHSNNNVGGFIFFLLFCFFVIKSLSCASSDDNKIETHKITVEDKNTSSQYGNKYSVCRGDVADKLTRSTHVYKVQHHVFDDGIQGKFGSDNMFVLHCNNEFTTPSDFFVQCWYNGKDLVGVTVPEKIQNQINFRKLFAQ